MNAEAQILSHVLSHLGDTTLTLKVCACRSLVEAYLTRTCTEHVTVRERLTTLKVLVPNALSQILALAALGFREQIEPVRIHGVRQRRIHVE